MDNSVETWFQQSYYINMRKEKFGVGNIVHVYNRGNRKQEIVRDDLDRWRFLQALFYLNNDISTQNPFRTLEDLLKPGFNRLFSDMIWPEKLGERKPLVKILAYVLKDNHFHLILEEIQENGITRFMHKLGVSLTNRFNTRYEEVGRLFQGPYKTKVVKDDNYLTYLNIYVQLKNVFEIYPGGFEEALKNFDKAFEFAKNYPYSSLTSYFNKNNFKIIEPDNLLEGLIENEKEFKDFAKHCLSKLSFDEKEMSIIY